MEVYIGRLVIVNTFHMVFIPYLYAISALVHSWHVCLLRLNPSYKGAGALAGERETIEPGSRLRHHGCASPVAPQTGAPIKEKGIPTGLVVV